jgi:TRAP-type C4-dicarboxylate transport system permease small subunit
MLAALAATRRALVRALEFAVTLLMAALVLDVLWQVFTRMASNLPRDVLAIDPSRWTDELAVMLLIWVALLGAVVAFDRKAHLGVDYMVARLPEGARRIAQVLAFALVAVFAAACMLYGGIVFVSENTCQLSPALGIPMSAVYVGVPVSGFFFLLLSLEALAREVAGYGRMDESPGGSAT